MDLEDLARRLAPTLLPGTFRHCLAVGEHAAGLARDFGADPARARLAGLLHDCAKNVATDEYVTQARAVGLTVLAEEEASPRVLHQRLGAVWARERFGASDEAVLAAISCHTTGRGEMDALARCLLVADYTSPDRDFAGVEALRRALRDGPDRAFVAVLRLKREIVERRGLPRHPWHVEAVRRWLAKP